jgi:hypothetical protein
MYRSSSVPTATAPTAVAEHPNRNEPLLHRQPDRPEVGRVFDLRNDADLPVVFHCQPPELVGVVLECRHTPQADVQRVVLPDVRQPLDRMQRIEFGEGEVRDRSMLLGMASPYR